MDVPQAITNRIIGMLERGGNVFRERWTRAAARGMPRNGKTRQPYHGANVLLLWDKAFEQGFSSNIWLTYRQAVALGAQVRKGEHGVLCAHFERKTRSPRSDNRSAQEARDSTPLEVDMIDHDSSAAHARSTLLCMPFWLFNVAQIDGLPSEVIELCNLPPSGPSSRPIESAMRLLGGSGAVIRHGFERAMYLPLLDEIRLPWPHRFTAGEAYCATALHELVHWTGHGDRLNRTFGARFGDAAYAFEELVAELGSAFVMGHCGLVDATIEGHAAYLHSWLKILRQDRQAIFTAARHAGAAFELILAMDMPSLDAVAPLPDGSPSA